MPRYYFDIRDEHGVHTDDVGLELSDMDTAIAEARRALVDMTRESLLSDGSSELRILIRDGNKGPVKLAVSVTTEWADE